MASKGALIGFGTIVAGFLLTVAGAPEVGIPLMVSGFLSSVAALALPGQDSAWKSSSTYGWDQFSNAAYDGMPMLTIYGEHRIAPPIVSLRSEQTGDEHGVTVLMCLGDLGLNGYEEVSDIRINDEPISSYPNISAQVKLTSIQTIKGLDKTGTPYTISQALTPKTWVTYTMRGSGDELALVLMFPGLYHVTRNGNAEGARFRARIQIRAKGSTADWDEIKGPGDYHTAFGKTLLGRDRYALNDDRTYMADNRANGWYRDSDGGWLLEAYSQGPKHQLIRFALPSNGSYEIRVMAALSNDESTYHEATLARVEEIRWESPYYGLTGLLQVRAIASAQLAGGLPQITCVVKGRYVWNPVTAEFEWSQNPVWCLRDFLLDPDYCGEWFDAADLDDGVGGTWRAAAAECDTIINRSTGDVRHELDLVIDTYAPAADWIRQMLVCCRGALIEYTDPTTLAASVKFIRDEARASVRTFDARTTRDSSTTRPILAQPDGRSTIAVRELPTDLRANVVRVAYYDRTASYVRRFTAEIKDSARIAAGDPEVRQELHMPGVTREYEALQQAQFILNRARLTPHVYSFRVGFGDCDLVPGDVVTVYADSPDWSSGQAMMVEDVTIEPLELGQGGAVLTCREYDANVYPSNIGGLFKPTRSYSNTYATLKPGRTNPPHGSKNVKAEMVYGSRHLRVMWDADGDTGRRYWRIYYSNTEHNKGTMLAEVEPEGRAYLIRDVAEVLHVIRVLAVSTSGLEEEWRTGGSTVVKRVTSLDVLPSTLTNANIIRVDASMSIATIADLSPAKDPEQVVEIIKAPTGVDGAWGQIVGRHIQNRDTGHVVRVAFPPTPIPPGRVAPGTINVFARPLNAGIGPGAAQAIPQPLLGGWANRVYTPVASVVGAVSSNFHAPSSLDGWTIDVNGIGLRALPPSSDWLGGWGTVSSTGLAPIQPSGAYFVTAATIACQTYDLGSTKDFVIECYDEACRIAASNPMGAIESRRMNLPSVPEDAEDLVTDTQSSPMWLFSDTLSDGTPLRAMPPTRWQVAYGASGDLGTWHEWGPGMMARGRYVRARMLLRDPIGLQRVVAPTVMVGVWTAHSDEAHTGVVVASTITIADITDLDVAQAGEIVGVVHNGGTVRLVIQISGTLYHVNLTAAP